MSMTISIVIPTCERYQSLIKLLHSVSSQKILPEEIIIVDSSEKQINDIELLFPALQIVYIHTTIKSVCAQRNIGIKKALGEYILLCDDDIEMPNTYISNLVSHVKKDPTIGAITGKFLQQKEDGKWDDQYPIKSMRELVWKFIFQQGIWGNIENIKTNFVTYPIYYLIKTAYKKRGNTYSLGGWPLITQYTSPLTKVAFYSLGACLVKKEWLKNSFFNETLGSHGIGDNYDVALRFPEFPAIYIATDNFVYHHKIQKNRLQEHISYQKRIVALHYFMINSNRFNLTNRLFLSFSLVGNWLYFLYKRNALYRKVTSSLIFKVIKKDSFLIN